MHHNQSTLDNKAIADSFLPPHLAGSIPEAVCEKLARSHYENFTVGSLFLPKEIRRHFFNIYAYCRVCDDLADETGDAELSLKLLEWWKNELAECFAGRPNHPVFKALRPTIEQFDLPIGPFEDLISAFVQDQTITRYQSYEQIMDYCRRSANPVGRIILYLLNYRDEARQLLSDFTCTALQLANFWQDIAVDYKKGRVYIPQEDLARFGYTEDELRNHIVNASFIHLMRFEIERTRELFERGAALHNLISGTGAVDVELFNQGGVELLKSIESSNYNIFEKHITVSKFTKSALLVKWGAKYLANAILKKR